MTTNNKGRRRRSSSCQHTTKAVAAVRPHDNKQQRQSPPFVFMTTNNKGSRRRSSSCQQTTNAVAAVRPHDNKQQKPWQRVNINSSKRNASSKQTCRNCDKNYPHAVGVNHVQRLVRTAEHVRNRITSQPAADPKSRSKTNRLITRLQRHMDHDRKTSVKFMRKQLKTHHPTILMDTRLLSATK